MPSLPSAGLTLVELLVVVAIITILAALLLGAAGKVRAQAHGARCLSNLRQMGMAFQMYANENDERIPYPNASYGGNNANPQLCWFNALDPYLLGLIAATGKAEENVSYIKQDPVIEKLGPQWLVDAHTLKMNERLGYDFTGSPSSEYIWSLADFPRPELSVLIFDGKAERNQLADGLPGSQAKQTQGTEGDVMRRHSDRANVLFVDGHTELRNEKHQTGGDGLGWKLDETSLIWKPWLPHP